MAFSSRGLRSVIQIVLAVVIVALTYFLYVSITEPYAQVKHRKEVTQQTRDRMNRVRTALITYQRANGRFLSTLDSLLIWVESDSLMIANTDSIFGTGFVVDSLIYSPRTGKKFEYALNDTSRTHTYLLSDPDSGDRIGTLEGDITRLNAASWE